MNVKEIGNTAKFGKGNDAMISEALELYCGCFQQLAGDAELKPSLGRFGHLLLQNGGDYLQHLCLEIEAVTDGEQLFSLDRMSAVFSSNAVII